MPTTVVQTADRARGEPGYTDGRVDPEPRLRRPAYLLGLDAQPSMYMRRIRTPGGPDFMPMRGLGVTNPCPEGHTYRKVNGQCFCDPVLMGLGGLGFEIPCPMPTLVSKQIPSVTAARTEQQRTAVVYKAPSAEVAPSPTVPPPPPGTEPLPEAPVIGKAKPTWVPYVLAGGAGVVVFWMLFRRKKGRR